jgi:Lrp/AsnC family transcriptional regulator for asnA, asnC and gidA
LEDVLSLKTRSTIAPFAIGFQANARVKCVISPPHLESAIKQICAFPEVIWVEETIGKTNLIVELWCLDYSKLNKFFLEKLLNIEELIEIETSFISEIYNYYPAFYNLLPLAHISFMNTRDRSRISNYSNFEYQNIPSGETHALNEVDIKIIKQLAKDGRKSFTDIAGEIGVSLSTVHLRYKQLVKNNILNVFCWIDPKKLGFHIAAYFDLSITPRDLHKATDKILTWDESVFVAQKHGAFNLGVAMYAKDRDHLEEFTSTCVEQIAGLRHMEMLLLAKTHKQALVIPNLDLLVK